MKRTAEEAAQTRVDILDAALSVFSQKGYTATRLQDIAAEAGVTRGAVYHHFDGKSGLFIELMQAASSSGNDIVADAMAEGGTFVDVCERVLTRSFEMIATDRKARQTMTIYLFKSDFSAELAEFAEQLKETAITSVQAVAGLMQTGIEQGVLKADIDPNVAARAFLAFQTGVIQHWLINPDAFFLQTDAPALARAFVYGIAR